MDSKDFEAIMDRLAQVTGIHSQIELASMLDLNRSAISRAKKRGKMPEKWIVKLSAMFDLDPDWLRHGQSSLDQFVEIPFVQAKLGAGGGSHVVDADVKGYFAFRNQWLLQKGRVSSMVLMEVIGDSMEPVIHEADLVLIDQSQQEIYSGAIYALGLAETIMVKRLEKYPSQLLVVSANPRYASIALQGDELDTVRIIGRIVGMWRDFF